ncbi:hypothetical protein CU097_015539 [Rhizopus azygosporus]|uniref:Uncharacterized protein n=1 Tax=Rhizopus azygosporus TaxID=86630 RepID=A0A367KDB4_RHIAZ|nr:hypothetical protein CU097_015539 [Rhizopus azygosporus]
MAESLESFKLPLKWKPGADLMSKMLLSDPEIIRIIIHSFIDVYVPPESYSVAPTEWADTKGVYTLYTSQNTSNEKFIPILAAFQEEVNQATILETIERLTLVYKNFRILPTVLVISIKSRRIGDGLVTVTLHDRSFFCRQTFFKLTQGQQKTHTEHTYVY